MDNPQRIYELLLDHCTTDAIVEQVLIGVVWTYCRAAQDIGLSMSPQIPTRTLSWPGSLVGKPLIDLAAWITTWEPYQAGVAMAAINACLNTRPLPDAVSLDNTVEHANLAVFDYFLPHLIGKKVVVIGRYPGMERYKNQLTLQTIEQQPGAEDYPSAACEYLIPEADWVFITASSIPNKTFPRLAELASSAKTVLMGPTTPWLPQMHEFGIDYLAGVEVSDPQALVQTVAEGGGRRIFNQAVRYRIAELTPSTSMFWLKQQIAECATEKIRLTKKMEEWYENGHRERFPAFKLLEQITQRLSRMDSSYKVLWDQHHQTVSGN